MIHGVCHGTAPLRCDLSICVKPITATQKSHSKTITPSPFLRTSDCTITEFTSAVATVNSEKIPQILLVQVVSSCRTTLLGVGLVHNVTFLNHPIRSTMAAHTFLPLCPFIYVCNIFYAKKITYIKKLCRQWSI